MSEPADDLVEQLRQIAAERPTTESELRSLTERARALADALAEEMAASEARLTELAEEPDSSLVEAAAELRRVERLKPAVEELRALLEVLEERARRLRTEWLLRRGPR